MAKHCIVFTVDRNYLPHLATALVSFLRFHNSNSATIGLIYSDIDQNELEVFKKYFAAKGLKIVSFLAPCCFDDIKTGSHFNKVIFYRLLAPELFNEHRKILYIDCDILFCANVYSLFDVELGDSVLAAIDRSPFSGVPRYLQNATARYFASGLLLIDTRRFTKALTKERCIKFLKNHYYEMPDQDALNYAVPDFKSIHPSYSVETSFLVSDCAFADMIGDPKIIQFSGSSKPWHLANKHPYKRHYWLYRNMSPYASRVADDLSLKVAIKAFTPLWIKNQLKALRIFNK